MKIPSVTPEGQRTGLPRRMRLALVGLGEAARNIHVPAVELITDADLVAGVDLDEGGRKWLRNRASRAETFSDVTAMLKATRPDWVILATPPSTHRELCIEALKSGANVFCEKPFVENSQDAGAILEAEQESGRRVVVNHEFPHMRIFQSAIEMARSQSLGKVKFLQFWEHLWEEPGKMAGWRAQHLTMREFGTHVADLAVQIYGAFPTRVYAQMDSPDAPANTDLVDVVTLTFPGGRLASIVLDRVSRGPHRYLEMRMDAEQASLRASFGSKLGASVGLNIRSKRPSLNLDFCAGGQSWLERGDSRELVTRESINPFAEATARHLVQALRATEANRAPKSHSREALTTVRLVEAVYQSARSNQPVDFDATVGAE